MIFPFFFEKKIKNRDFAIFGIIAKAKMIIGN